MTAYRVTAPMVLLKVKGHNGPQIHNFYAGATVPESVAEVDGNNLRRHVDRGWVEPVAEPVAEPAPQPKAPASNPDDQVPDGTADKVLAWVGDNADRALAALVTEQNKEKPRSTLIDQLTKTAGL